MSYKLIIVESPAKCNKIEKYLGSGYKCIASYGHITELDGLKSIDIENNFKATFKIANGKNQQVSKIKNMLKDTSEVIIATDDDREGEAIGWHLCNVLKLPVNTTRRMIFHEVTETAIQKAVSNLTKINMNLVYSQQARQILDLIVGFKISPILWKKISHTEKGLSAGRCQTPALKLVYENQKEIDVSPGKKMYNTTGYFTSKNLPFTLNYNHDNEEKLSTFLEDSANYKHKYRCGDIKNLIKSPPTPFTTSKLQQSASNELNISPKDTMKSCQILYEAGYITYMRTDSTTYSKEFIDISKNYIIDKYGSEYVHLNIDSLSEKNDKSVKKTKKEKNNNAQEAHEAIRPTDIKIIELDNNIGSRELRLYKLIHRNTLESCMSTAKYNTIKAIISAPDSLEYNYSTEQVVFPGWKIVAGYEKESPILNYLQTIKNDTIINYKKITAKVTMKDLKTHYTEAKLVQLLEQKGIGRPSTYSSLIDKIQERNYVKKMTIKGKEIECIDFELQDEQLTEISTKREFGNEKNKLVMQPIGIIVIEFLINNFDTLFKYDYTKNMEDKLDVIAKGDLVWYNLCKECLNDIDSLTSNIQLYTKDVIKIDDKHSYIIGKYGPVIKCEDNGNTTFKKVKEDIDVKKLQNGEYSLEDLLLQTNNGKNLGKYKNIDVILKNGKFGPYVEYNNQNKSIKNLLFDDIKLEDVISLLEESSSFGIIRKIDEDTSIRSGKYGDYIYHKKIKDKKPQFIKLNTFISKHGVNSYKTCEDKIIKEWIKNVLHL